MVALAVILSLIAFVTADALVRLLLDRLHEIRKRKEWAKALNAGLNLTFSDELKSLKRIEVKEPKAKILAVDDEQVILDVFRKFLVLAGYSVDTVLTGPEALTLVRQNDYDFVFTDLKMPVMEGTEVVKAVKHLRPDIDVIVVTGYGTIESAVETMKFGAMDYIQKPFTEDELVQMVNRFVLRRQDRLARASLPKLHLVTPSVKESSSPYQFNVLSGVFLSPGHTWVSVEPNGAVCIGLDDFAQKIIGNIDGIELPVANQVIQKGMTLFTLHQNSRRIDIPSPVSGQVKFFNSALVSAPNLINTRPYDAGWVCRLEADNLPADLSGLKIGSSALNWYHEEIERLQKEIGRDGAPVAQQSTALDDNQWSVFSRGFLLAK